MRYNWIVEDTIPFNLIYSTCLYLNKQRGYNFSKCVLNSKQIHIKVEWGIQGLHGVWPVKHILVIKKTWTPPATIGPGLGGEGPVATPLAPLPGLREMLRTELKVSVPLPIPCN